MCIWINNEFCGWVWDPSSRYLITCMQIFSKKSKIQNPFGPKHFWSKTTYIHLYKSDKTETGLLK